MPAFSRVGDLVARGERCIGLSGLRGSAKSVFCSSLCRVMTRPLLILTSDAASAERWKDDLSTWIGEENVWLFPPEERSPRGRHDPDPEAEGQRVLTLWNLSRGMGAGIALSPVTGLLTPVVSPAEYQSGIIEISVGERWDRDDLLLRLVGLGFERVPTIEEVGEVGVRGGILDVFTFSHSYPMRVEFIEDTIVSIRDFEVTTQRSISRKEKILILPPSDRSLSSSPAATLLDYLPAECLVALDEPEMLEEAGLSFEGRLAGQPMARSEDPEDLADSEAQILRFQETMQRASTHQTITLRESRGLGGQGEGVDFGTGSFEPTGGNFPLLRRRLRSLLEGGYRVYVFCATAGERERMEEILQASGPESDFGHGGARARPQSRREKEWEGEESVEPLEGPLFLDVGSLQSGFLVPAEKLAVLADQELFQREPVRRFRRFKGGRAIRDLSTLKGGDFCVHADYGIGRYQGLQKLTVDGRQYDCLILVFQDGDRIYVPVEEMKRVETYTVEEGRTPALTKLGTAQWETTKRRAKKAIADMARDLLTLYAYRKSQKGHALPPEKPWERELQASFPYEETPDQLKAEADIIHDLESNKPMERLICGDVGYGKTELAIRAAFKAVLDSKQVAVLVPTTVLAQQHYRTFSDRLKAYPVNIEMLSRFCSRPEQKRTVEGLKHGRVDIVIGTHRLLQRDVVFKGLGLLVIDEEQRFGVAHKERLKLMRREVDVLSMTATPIPRTLHMSLLGVRDMTTIETPPKERLPIITEIVEWDEQVIYEAIMREISRGGQIYFLHNRVESIEAMAGFLRRLVPGVGIGIGHGQLPEGDLARVMLDFYRSKFEILLATTIIESGLDLPNVNTIIINRADRFGLADLYQLRGRVGRSNRRAYAYLLIPRRKSLTPTARKRLATLEELADLGTGFRLALRDLEIRGTGNLLGREQHGHMIAIGFDLYCKLVEEAVRELKGEPPREEFDPRVTVEVDAYLPDSFVPDQREKISIYRRLSEARNLGQIEDLGSELTDRFGALPQVATNLLQIVRLRVVAREIGLERMSLKGVQLDLEYRQGMQPKGDQLAALVRASKWPPEFVTSKTPSGVHRLGIRFRLSGGTAEERLGESVRILGELKGVSGPTETAE